MSQSCRTRIKTYIMSSEIRDVISRLAATQTIQTTEYHLLESKVHKVTRVLPLNLIIYLL